MSLQGKAGYVICGAECQVEVQIPFLENDHRALS